VSADEMVVYVVVSVDKRGQARVKDKAPPLFRIDEDIRKELIFSDLLFNYTKYTRIKAL
jgi:hypothetical protein